MKFSERQFSKSDKQWEELKGYPLFPPTTTSLMHSTTRLTQHLVPNENYCENSSLVFIAMKTSALFISLRGKWWENNNGWYVPSLVSAINFSSLRKSTLLSIILSGLDYVRWQVTKIFLARLNSVGILESFSFFLSLSLP